MAWRRGSPQWSCKASPGSFLVPVLRASRPWDAWHASWGWWAVGGGLRHACLPGMRPGQDDRDDAGRPERVNREDEGACSGASTPSQAPAAGVIARRATTEAVRSTPPRCRASPPSRDSTFGWPGDTVLREPQRTSIHHGWTPQAGCRAACHAPCKLTRRRTPS